MYRVRDSLRIRKTKRSLGSGIVETAVGLILVIPVLLCLVDVAALVLAQTANDSLAKQCARAAAEQIAGSGDPNAQVAFNGYPNSSLITKQSCITVYPPPSGGNVTVQCTTTILCTLPVPIPFGGPASQVFAARAIEPVVGQMP